MMRWAHTVSWILVTTVLVMSPAAAQQGAPANGEWPTYGGDLGSTKYSPLNQINATNFGDLEVAWRWQSADAYMSMTTPDGGEWRAASDVIFGTLNESDPDRWRDGQPPYTNNLKATPLMVGPPLLIRLARANIDSQDLAIDQSYKTQVLMRRTMRL